MRQKETMSHSYLDKIVYWSALSSAGSLLSLCRVQHERHEKSSSDTEWRATRSEIMRHFILDQPKRIEQSRREVGKFNMGLENLGRTIRTRGNTIRRKKSFSSQFKKKRNRDRKINACNTTARKEKTFKKPCKTTPRCYLRKIKQHRCKIK